MSSDSQTSVRHALREQPESFRARELTASLTVKDLPRSLAFYRDALGFTVAREHQRDGKVLAVSFVAGAIRLLITQDDGAKGWDRSKGEGISLQLTTTQNLDNLAARIKQFGSALESEPADTPWGVRMFRVQDPDGFKLVFASERS